MGTHPESGALIHLSTAAVHTPDTPITLVIADAQALMRAGIRVILESAGFTVLACAETGAEALALAAAHAPDILLLDLDMPGVDGPQTVRDLRAIDPGVSVIVLALQASRGSVSDVLRAGARGYMPKSCDGAELLRGIGAVSGGRLYVMSDETRGPDPAAVCRAVVLPLLSLREREVLGLVAEGLTSKAIAHRLGIVKRTVESHRNHIVEKLGLHSVAELTKYAVREGLSPLER